MRQRLLAGLALWCGALAFAAQDATKPSREAEFAPPVRMMADGRAVRVEAPGYAAPCWYDVDGDGKLDLLVGQFNQGKIHVHKNLGDLKFAKGTWLQAEGKVAEVPGVW